MEDTQFHRIAKVLSDPRRLSILASIAQEKVACGQSLCTQHPVTKATMSHHIAELEEAGLIEIERQGKFLHARLRKEVWREYVRELKKRIG
jgi:ArsR family transcriptional regulator